MSSIIIREQNLESLFVNTDFTDIAYVPGFGDASIEGAPKANAPTYVETVEEFTALFGKEPQKFTANYPYADNFETTAYDTQATSNNLFDKDAYDPAWTYATEILKSGIPIFYERINDGTSIDAANMYSQFIGGIVERNIFEKHYGSDMSGGDKVITLKNMPTVTNNKYNVISITKSNSVELINSYQKEGVTSFVSGTTTISHTPVKAKSIKLLDVNGVQVDDADGLHPATVDSTTGKVTQESFKTNKSAADVEYIEYTYAGEDAYTVMAYSESATKVTITLSKAVDHSDYVIVKYTTKQNLNGSIFKKLIDRGTYRIKYLTTGGYPIFEHKHAVTILNNIREAVANDETNTSKEGATQNGRRDLTVFVDHTNYSGRPLGTGTNVNSVFNVLNTTKYKEIFTDNIGTYFTMVTPWTKLKDSTTKTKEAPASLLYLKKAGEAVQANIRWDSIAGVARGCVDSLISEVLTDEPLTATIANAYQSETKDALCMNAITNVFPYGQCIMGIRTLEPVSAQEQLTSDNILNLRLLISDIKKKVYQAAKSLMFEQNSDVLWVKFKSKLLPLLEQMKASNMIESYSLTQEKSSKSYSATVEDMKRMLKANLEIVPVYPVEKFDITIAITDSDTTAEEVEQA